MNLENYSVRFKIALPLVLIAILTIGFSAYNTSGSHKLGAHAEQLEGVFIEAISLTLNADRDLYQALTANQNYIAYNNNESVDLKVFEESFYENAEQALQRMNQVRVLIQNYPALLADLQGFEADYNDWFQRAKNVLETAKQGDLESALLLNSTTQLEAFDRLRNYYDKVGEFVTREADATAKNATQLSTSLIFSQSIGSVIIVAASIFSIIFGPRIVTSRLKQVTRAMREISEGDGDLRSRIDQKGKDEITELAIVFNDLMSNLQNLVKEIKVDTDKMSMSESQLKEAFQQNSEVIGKQNQNLDTIGAAVHELSVTVQEVVKNTQTVSTDMASVESMSHESLETVNSSVQYISLLSDSISLASTEVQNLANESQQIMSVLDVIKSIAEQTNLLALNAAIEAARAGEQGRGFAVVADEVRTLASRTQKSTEDINRMLGGLEKRVSEVVETIGKGNGQVEKVVSISDSLKSFLQNVNSSIGNTNSLMKHINMATKQQGDATQEISQSISKLHELSVSSVGIAHQANDAASQVAQSINSLEVNTGRFSI